MIHEDELTILKNKVDSLEKRDTDLIIADFDDTIFSRKEQLEDSELLRNNRWDKWNEVMKNIIWFENMIKNYYLNKEFPTTITKKLRKNHDLILTAWVEEFQNLKLIACKLNDTNFKVVNNAEDKIIETIRYVLYTLKFIPSTIVVYEDRPKYFIEYKDLIEKVLWTKVIIKKVTMNWNNNDPIIEDI